MSILKVNSLGLTINDSVLLENISFEVAKDEVVAIIGPNGAGKTTLAKCILGILEPTSGSIEFGGREIKISYIPQRLVFDRDFPISVEEFVSIQHEGKLSADDRELFRELGVEKLFGQRFGSLSGGELQRLMIALALAKEPDLVIMDEPVSGIDIGGEETVYSLLRTEQLKRKYAMIIISHDVDFVIKYADRVVCMNKCVMCTGAPGKVLTQDILAKAYGSELAEYQHKFKHKGHV